MMKKFIFSLTASVIAGTSAYAQSVTYNHDSAKKNQITVMETGSGALSPELYYWALHNNYKKSASSKNKLSFRTLAGINLYNQTDEAEAIDSALTQRARIEALNVADRQIDLAWLAEGDKLNNLLGKFKENIDRIVPSGGNVSDRQRWNELYQMYRCAVKATKDAYMPNAQRKREYLRIYEDIASQNDILVRLLVQFNNQMKTDELLATTGNYTKANKAAIIANATGKWKEAGFSTRGNNGSDGTDGSSGDGDESVNR